MLGGAGWDGLLLPPNVRAIGHCPTALHPVLNSSARLVLNINREAMAATGFSPPTRVFEAAAAAPASSPTPGRASSASSEPRAGVLVAGGPQDLVRYLETVSPEAARAVGGRARRRALRDHTYASRAVTFERAAQALCAPRPWAEAPA